MKEKIMAHAGSVFFRQGIKTVTMDELCSEMGISKKTLYVHFENKEELVGEVVGDFIRSTMETVYFLMEGASNSVEGFCEIADHVFMTISRISPAMIHDIRKYYPSIWDDIQEFKRRSIENMVFENMKRGIAEGLYREEINPDLVMRFYLTVILNMNDEELFPTTLSDPASVYSGFVNYHLRSICTPEGYEIYLRHTQKAGGQRKTKTYRDVIEQIVKNRKIQL
ncbi:MAG: TetR/AcrR family transcriptional regulator [Saprospirales bacterium]|nr:MAG: TetR/AcrR family transcriptional regulator [Saprospirales bacterium]